jgi:hypothetical protein
VADGQALRVPRPRQPVHTRLVYRKRDRSPPGGGQGSEEDTATLTRRHGGTGTSASEGGAGGTTVGVGSGLGGGSGGARSGTGAQCVDRVTTAVEDRSSARRSMSDGDAAEHAPLKTLLLSPRPHLLPSKGSNGQEQERGFAAKDEDKGDLLTTGLACLKHEPTTDDPMLLEAAIHDGKSSMQLGRSTSWASLGFISVEQPATGGPLFLNPSGIWTNDDTPMVPSSWIPPPDFLTGPSSDPMLEGAIEAVSLPVLDVDAEHGHVARSPRALSRVLPLKLKGNLVECVLSCS